jgi:hypothetical protein
MSEMLRSDLKAFYSSKIDGMFESYKDLVLKSLKDKKLEISLMDPISRSRVEDLESLNILKYKGANLEGEGCLIYELTTTGEDLTEIIYMEDELKKSDIKLTRKNEDVFLLETVVTINTPTSEEIARNHEVYHYSERGKPIYAVYCPKSLVWSKAEQLKEARKELEEAIDVHEQLHI